MKWAKACEMLHEQQGYVMLHANAPCLNVQLAHRWGTAIENLLTVSHTHDGMNPTKKEEKIWPKYTVFWMDEWMWSTNYSFSFAHWSQTSDPANNI